MKTLKEWQDAAGLVANTKGFASKAENIHRSLLMIVGEITEAQNELRVGREPQEIYYSDTGKPEGVPVELADVVLRIFNLAHDLGIDLEAAVELKHNYNMTRPFKHGGKLF